MLVLLAAVTNAAFFVLQKPLLKEYGPLEVVTFSTWITTLLLLPFGDNAVRSLSMVGLESIFSVIYIGIVSVIAHICWSKVLSKIDASKAAIYLYTVPVMTIVIGFLWLTKDLYILLNPEGYAQPVRSLPRVVLASGKR
jgi:drug/metabolite transporter (DMT)-like permease